MKMSWRTRKIQKKFQRTIYSIKYLLNMKKTPKIQTQWKVFKVKSILFPFLNYKYFIDYYRSCKSVKKQAGCCMHVAAYIHYLSFARYNNSVKLPSVYLNSVLLVWKNTNHQKNLLMLETKDTDSWIYFF